MAKAILKNYRQSPRKVRLVANAVRGQKVNTALVNLDFIPKRSALPLKKLIESAVANATNNEKIDIDSLVIKSIQVDQGFTMKRWRARARGTAHPIRKKTCKVTVVVEGISLPETEKKVTKKAVKAVKAETK